PHGRNYHAIRLPHTLGSIGCTGNGWRHALIEPKLEFVYEAGGELDVPCEIGKVVDGTRRIIPIKRGGYVKGPRISGHLMGNSADWQLTRPDGVTVADAIYAIETDDGALIQIRN